MPLIDRVAEAVIGRGDLAHLALILWAGAASFLALALLRELALSNKRFEDFVRELARFNSRHGGDDP